MHTPADGSGVHELRLAPLKDYFPPSENAEYMEDGYTKEYSDRGLYPHHEHRDRPGPRAFLLLW